MDKYVCKSYGYEYDPEVEDPENGIAPGTAFEYDRCCTICGVEKDMFKKLF